MNFYAARLKSIRELNGLSQKELAKKAGVTSQAISLYERGDNQPRPKTVYRLAKSLGCSVYDISDIKPQSDDPALQNISLNTSVNEAEQDEYIAGDPLLRLIVQYCQKYDRHQKPDIIKLLGMWRELDQSQRSHCLHCMEGLLRSSQGGAASA